MELIEWIELIRNAKTGVLSSSDPKLKVFTNPEHTILTIRSDEERCHHCNRESESKSVVVTFKKPVKLTIFEAGLLYYLFVRNKKPMDYGAYHLCVAGKNFIENIKGVETNV